MSSIISFTFREAVVDVAYKGKNFRRTNLLYIYRKFHFQKLLLFSS